jgi:hypothetical protein
MGLVYALFLELGMWTGWLFIRLGSRSQIRQTLAMGTNAQRSFPIVDRQLEKKSLSASAMQRKTAAGITRGIRFVASTRICELAILRVIQEKWPGAKQGKVEVNLHL